MRSNIDYIAEYLRLNPGMNPLALFNTYYGIVDSRFHHDNWEKRKIVPLNMNNWCEQKVHQLRQDRAGIRAVIVNPVQIGGNRV